MLVLRFPLTFQLRFHRMGYVCQTIVVFYLCCGQYNFCKVVIKSLLILVGGICAHWQNEVDTNVFICNPWKKVNISHNK